MPQPFQDLDMQKFQNLSVEEMKKHLFRPAMPPIEINNVSKIAELSHFLVQNFRSEISAEEHIIDIAKKTLTALQSSNEEREKEIERLKLLIYDMYSNGIKKPFGYHWSAFKEQNKL